MKKGFTLLELLITTGIIAIVAVLTLPALLRDHQKRVFTTQLQRTFNTVSGALPAYLENSTAVTLFDTDAFNARRRPKDVSKLVTFVKNNFKTNKICTKETDGGTQACYGSVYKRLSGAKNGTFSGEVCAILKTGASVCFNRMSSRYEFPYLFIDVNGPKGPNVWGRDAYQFEVNNEAEIAESFMLEMPDSHKSEYCADNQYGGGCFNRIVERGWVMDY